MAKSAYKLSTIILILAFVSVLISSGLFAVASYLSADKLLKQEISQAFEYRHRIIQLALDEKLSRTSARLETLSHNSDFYRAIATSNSERIDELLFTILQNESAQSLDVLILSGEQGRIIGDVSSPLSALAPYKKELVLKAQETFNNWTVVELNGPDQNLLALMYSVPVIEPDVGRVVGAIHGVLSLSGNVLLARELMNVAEASELLLLEGDRLLVSTSGLNGEVLAAQLGQPGEVKQIGGQNTSKKQINLDDLGGHQIYVAVLEDSVEAGVSIFEVYSIGALLIILGALASAVFVAVMVRYLVAQNSAKLLGYVGDVMAGKRHAHYQPGTIHEFNHLGDIVDRMVTKIHENERYLTNLIELANSPIVAWDQEGRIIRFNRAAERIFGRDSEAVIGFPVYKVLRPISVSGDLSDRSVLERSLDGAVIDDWEMVHVNPESGQDVYLSWSIAPVSFAEDGTIETVLAQGQDVTRRRTAEEGLQRINEELELRVIHRTRALQAEISDRRLIEEELRQSEERFRDIAEATSDWFWEMGPDLRFTYISDRAGVMTGIDPSAVVGKTRAEMISPEFMERERDKWDRHLEILERHEPFKRFEYTSQNLYGEERVFRISGVPIQDMKTGEFKGYRGAARDVTSERIREREIQTAREQAESASQAKTEFLSSMSHELRTPLNGILGFAQLLNMSPEKNLSDRQNQFVSQIIKAGEHLLELINEILDLSKIESRQVQFVIEGVEPVRVVQEVHDLLDSLASSNGVTILNNCTDKTLPAVSADYLRLKQILVNLGANAIKYNQRGGTATFAVNICSDENALEFSVHDDGSGIPKEELETIFQPFNRLGADFSEVEGTGIGLTITRQLVELMHGSMGVESEVDKGSRFWFRLPLFVSDGDQLQSLNEREAFALSESHEDFVAPSREITVLYIEDNVYNRMLMEETVAPLENVALIMCETAEEGLRLARTRHPSLIFLDINLPGMNGWELIEILKDDFQTEDIPVAAVTSQAMKQDRERIQEAGFDYYLPKPLSLKRVIELIQYSAQSQ